MNGTIKTSDPQELRRRDFHGEYDASGVDLSLLRYMLALSPLERLRIMEAHARDIALLQEYGRKERDAASRPNR